MNNSYNDETIKSDRDESVRYSSVKEVNMNNSYNDEEPKPATSFLGRVQFESNTEFRDDEGKSKTLPFFVQSLFL